MKYIKKYENIDWDNEWDFEDIEENDIPNEFKGNEDFYKFLVHNDILNKFLYNFNLKSQQLWRYKYNIPTKLSDYLRKVDKYDYIHYPFSWIGEDTIDIKWDMYNSKWREK